MNRQFIKRILIVLIALIAAGSIITVAAYALYSKKVTEGQTEVTFTEPENVLGDIVSINDMKYTVNGIATSQSLGSEALNLDAENRFLQVEITMKNTGTEPRKIVSSFFHLKHDDVIYEMDADATFTANQDENGNIDNAFLYETIEPNEEKTGTIVFDAPEAVVESDNKIMLFDAGNLGGLLQEERDIEVGI